MTIRIRVSILLLLLCLGLIPVQSVQAHRGTRLFRDFAYGVSINPLSPPIDNALHLAANLNPDWLLVAFDWQLWFPTQHTAPNWQPLDETLRFADQHNLAICLRISNAPAWALNANGPDQQATIALLHLLLDRYPASIQAIELFPGANSTQGWGAMPSARAYQELTLAIDNSLKLSAPNLTLVAGGLILGEGQNTPDQINGFDFLQELYAAGIKNTNAVLSLQLINLNKDPFQLAGEENEPVLRHIDAVRQIMLQNQHEEGLVWITALSIQDKEESADRINNLATTCSMLRSRLFIGTIVPAALNTLPSASPSPALLEAGAEDQLLFTTLNSLITSNRQQNPSPAVSRQKETPGSSKEIYVHDQPNPFQHLLARLSALSCAWFGHCQ